MEYSNMNDYLDDLEEIFDDIKENVINYSNSNKKNKLLYKICDHGSCGNDKCIEALNNGYLEDIERLKNKINSLESNIELFKLNENKSKKVERKNMDTQDLLYKKENEFLRLDVGRFTNDLEEAKKKHDAFIHEIDKMKMSLDSSNSELVHCRDEIRKQTEIIRRLRENEKNMQLSLERAIEEKFLDKKTIKNLKNEIMDLKGSIRVFCRIKPTHRTKATIRLDDSSIEILNNNKSLEFQFDKVFDDRCLQTQVFAECFDIVESVFDGYKICLFAYGQTGSGKTHTMEGDIENPGLLYQSLGYIFDSKKKYEDNGWNVEIKCNYVEIYNDEIFDLLNDDILNLIGRGKVESLKAKFEENMLSIVESKKSSFDKIKIIHEEGNTILKNCEERALYLCDDAIKLIEKSKSKRSVGKTLCNDRSSRSHSIFRLNIFMDREDERRRGSLCLIDLAGSERLNVSHSEGLRLKETQHINKSLSCLGDVFKAILENKSHIPFRNSKLTYLLQGY